MKYRHVFWALLLIAIGVLFILNNIGILDFGWWAFWSLWPLILIFWGISILPIKDWIKITCLVLVLAFSVIFFNRLDKTPSWLHIRANHGPEWEWNWDREDTVPKTYNYKEQSLTVPFDSLARKGVLRLDAAAGNFCVGGNTSDFLAFNKKGYVGNYSLTTSDNKGVKKIDLKMEETHIRGSMSKNQVDIRLNEKPSWNLIFDIGAAEVNLDLSNYKIDTTEVNAGASSIDIKLGDKSPLTKVTLNAGASSIGFQIPKGSGCQVKSESFMISKDFEGFDKVDDGLYQTPNFSGSKNKIYITVKTAISKIEIKRY